MTVPLPPAELDDLPCRVVVEIVTAYLDGALPPLERARLESHLAECDDCVEVVDQFRRTIAATGTLAEHDVEALDESARSALLGVFRLWSSQRDAPEHLDG